MSVLIFSIILFLVFLALGGFHFYWFLGGKWGLDSVIPSKGNNTITPSIPKLATLLVGFVLVSFGGLYLIKAGLLNVQVPHWVTNYVYWFIPAIFMLRAIGEFNYVGFFKKIKNTKFAEADTKIFAPLCFGIGVLGLLIQLVK